MQQKYKNYTPEDHQVWSILYNRQMKILKESASEEFLRGLELTEFEQERVPDFNKVNERLAKLTGWELIAVPGIVPDDVFFEMLANKKFPSTVWLRSMKQLDYLEEPDMFHDVFGHVPLLTNQNFCNYLQGISKIAHKHIDNALVIELMSRIYWFTVEFGLIREENKLKIYGAGILSSAGESVYSLQSEIPEKQDFDVESILNTPYIKSEYQVKYFVANGYDQLYRNLDKTDIVEEMMKAAG